MCLLTEKLLEDERKVKMLLEQGSTTAKQHNFVSAISLFKQAKEIPGFERNPEVLKYWNELSLHCKRVSLESIWLSKTFVNLPSPVVDCYLNEEEDLVIALSSSAENMTILKILSVTTGEEKSFSIEKCISAMTLYKLNKAMRHAFLTDQEGNFYIFDLVSGIINTSIKVHIDCITSMSLTEDYIVFSSADTNNSLSMHSLTDSYMSIYSFPTHGNLRTFQTPFQATLGTAREYMLSAHLSKNNEYILSGSNNNIVRLWDVKTGNCIKVFKGHTNQISAVFLTDDCKTAFSASLDGTVRMWDIASGNCRTIFKGHNSMITCIDISEDGRWLLSGGMDSTVKLWDVANGQNIWSSTQHTKCVNSVHLSKNCRWILSGSDDQTIHLWELEWNFSS